METKLDYDTLDEDYFPDIANVLLNHCYLKVGRKKFRLAEIEFYLKTNLHNDPYVHCDPDQLLMHTFYFHKFKTGTYKSGTFKGLDLTFGSVDDNAYFGILIRSIMNIKTGCITEGPCNTVNKILLELGHESIIELTDGQNLDIFENDKKLSLVRSMKLSPKEIYCGPRIGLSAKYPDFQARNYRFVIYPEKIKKQKKTLQKL